MTLTTENRSILLVEDDDDLRAIFARRLSIRGFTVFAAADADAAREAAAERKFDAAVIDRTLPGGDGLTLLEALRQIDAELQAVVMSGLSDEQAIAAACRPGVCDYLVKPFALTDLEAAVTRACAQGVAK